MAGYQGSFTTTDSWGKRRAGGAPTGWGTPPQSPETQALHAHQDFCFHTARFAPTPACHEVPGGTMICIRLCLKTSVCPESAHIWRPQHPTLQTLASNGRKDGGKEGGRRGAGGSEPGSSRGKAGWRPVALQRWARPAGGPRSLGVSAGSPHSAWRGRAQRTPVLGPQKPLPWEQAALGCACFSHFSNCCSPCFVNKVIFPPPQKKDHQPGPTLIPLQSAQLAASNTGH